MAYLDKFSHQVITCILLYMHRLVSHFYPSRVDGILRCFGNRDHLYNSHDHLVKRDLGNTDMLQHVHSGTRISPHIHRYQLGTGWHGYRRCRHLITCNRYNRHTRVQDPACSRTIVGSHRYVYGTGY